MPSENQNDLFRVYCENIILGLSKSSTRMGSSPPKMSDSTEMESTNSRQAGKRSSAATEIIL